MLEVADEIILSLTLLIQQGLSELEICSPYGFESLAGLCHAEVKKQKFWKSYQESWEQLRFFYWDGKN